MLYNNNITHQRKVQNMNRLLKWNFRRRFGLEYEFSNSSSHLSRMADVVSETTGQRAEVHGYRHTSGNISTWECKTDSSCGTELVSPILSGPSKLKVAAEVLRELEAEDFNIDELCGQHVHVEINDFSSEQLGIMAAYWMKIERFILNGTPSHRRENRYCELLTQRNSYISANQAYLPNNVLREMANGRDAINFQNMSNRGTVEFRFGEMTFDPEIIKNRVRFLIWFVEMCKILPAPENLNWLTPKQALRMFNLWENPDSIIKYQYSPAVQSMRKWLLVRLVEHAPVTFQRDIDRCKTMLEEIEDFEPTFQLEEECI